MSKPVSCLEGRGTHSLAVDVAKEVQPPRSHDRQGAAGMPLGLRAAAEMLLHFLACSKKTKACLIELAHKGERRLSMFVGLQGMHVCWCNGGLGEKSQRLGLVTSRIPRDEWD